MKAMKLGWIHARIALPVVAALVLAGCGQSTAETSNKPPGSDALPVSAEYSGPLKGLPTSYPEVQKKADLTVGFLIPNGAVEVLSALGRAMDAAVKAQGGKVITYDAQAQPDKQVTQMQQLVDRGVNAIVVWPLDAKALDPVIRSASAKGIPVIGMEVNPDPNGDIGQFTTQVTTGADQVGFNSAREMARVSPSAEVAIAGFVVPVPSIRAQTEAMGQWAKKFGLKVVAEVENQTDDVAGGMTAAGGALAQNPNIAGVLAYSDQTAIGAALAARESGRQIQTIGTNGGSDAFEAIKQGRLHATLQFPIATWAQQLTRAAYSAVLSPNTKLPKTVYPEVLPLITAENVSQAKTFDEQIASIKG